tara:strand:- start:47 stop:1141 length:1095 start_codon:yes stop_codon:yes gene_type:complete
MVSTLPYNAELDAQAKKHFGDNYGKTSLKINPSFGSAANIQSTLIDPFYKTDGQWDDEKINQSISNAVRRNLGGPTATIDDSYRDYLVEGVKDGSVNPLKINESLANSKRGANIFNLAMNNAGWVVPPTLQGDDIDAIVDQDFGGDFGKFALNEFHKNLPQFIDPATGDPTSKYLGLAEDAKRKASSGETPNPAYIFEGVDNSPTGPASATDIGGTHEGLPEGANPLDAITAPQGSPQGSPQGQPQGSPPVNTDVTTTPNWYDGYGSGAEWLAANPQGSENSTNSTSNSTNNMDDFMKFMMMMSMMGGFGGRGGYGGSQYGYGGLNPGGVQAAYNPLEQLQGSWDWFNKSFGSGVQGGTTANVQ